MKNEDYVSLECAKLLEEKGFNEPCDSRHVVYEDGKYKFERYKTFDIKKDIGIVKIKDGCFYDSYLAHTLYEAQKWLREKHNIHIDVRCTAYCKPLNRCDYMCEVFALSDHIFCDTKVFHKYEEALNEGILKALQLV